jgi:ABC-type nickel/cobalt efflux system permease component RcnA
MPSIVRHAISASIRLQSKLNERLQETLASQRDRSDLFAAWMIVLCSFAYSVLHALDRGTPDRPLSCRGANDRKGR